MVLIGALASKNAILIVEFARDLRTQGQSIHGAAIAAAKMRFRPILMTSFAFILGVLPSVFATGAAAAGRNEHSSPMCTSQLRRLYLYCGSTHQKSASQEEKEATQ